MKEFKASTKRGKQIIDMGKKCNYNSLGFLYNRVSINKQKAFEWCYKQYLADEGCSFGVGNANSYGFTASWLLIKDGLPARRVVTKNNDYLVWLNR